MNASPITVMMTVDEGWRFVNAEVPHHASTAFGLVGSGNSILMDRWTYEGLGRHRPATHVSTLVYTDDYVYEPEVRNKAAQSGKPYRLTVIHDLDRLNKLRRHLVVYGGEQLTRAMLPYATAVHATMLLSHVGRGEPVNLDEQRWRLKLNSIIFEGFKTVKDYDGNAVPTERFVYQVREYVNDQPLRPIGEVR